MIDHYNNSFSKTSLKCLMKEIDNIHNSLLKDSISRLPVYCTKNTFQNLNLSRKRTVEFGTETAFYREPQAWNLLTEFFEKHLLSKYQNNKKL